MNNKYKLGKRDLTVINDKVKKTLMPVILEIRETIDKKNKDKKTFREELVNLEFKEAKRQLVNKSEKLFNTTIEYLQTRNEDYKKYKATSFKGNAEYNGEITKYMALFNGQLTPKVVDMLKAANDIEALECLASGKFNESLKLQIGQAIDEIKEEDKAIDKTIDMLNEIKKATILKIQTGMEISNASQSLSESIDKYMTGYENEIIDLIGEEVSLFENEEFYDLKDYAILVKYEQGSEREAIRVKTNLWNEIQAEHQRILQL